MAQSGISLSAIATQARQGLKIAIGVFFLFVVGRVVLEWSIATYKRLNPPPPAPPTYGFQLLPQIEFPNQSATARPKNIVLDTVGKGLPDYGIKSNVYMIPAAQPNLLALDRAKQQASALGFIAAPEKVSSNLYRWRRSEPIPATLEIDIVHSTLKMRADWGSSIDLLSRKEIPAPRQLDAELKSILRAANVLSDDLATATAQITYVRAVGGEVREAPSISDADFVQADFFRSTPHGYPGVTSERDHGVIRIMLSGSRRQGERLLLLEAQYYPVMWINPETYPLQSAKQALQALQAGGGFITKPVQGDTATIRNVYLGFYEPTTPQSFYQPVYVFEGDDEFQAIIPALDPRSFTPTE